MRDRGNEKMVNLLNSQATGVFLAKSDDNLFLFHCNRAQRIKRKKFINAGEVLKKTKKQKKNKTKQNTKLPRKSLSCGEVGWWDD